jgi:hypothetical protein
LASSGEEMGSNASLVTVNTAWLPWKVEVEPATSSVRQWGLPLTEQWWEHSHGQLLANRALPVSMSFALPRAQEPRPARDTSLPSIHDD